MELASLAILSFKELDTHRAQYPASYEKLITTPTHTHRYYGQSPLLCYGEYVRECLDKPHHLSVYLEQLEVNSWYGCVMDADGVLQERIGSLSLLSDIFAYDIHQCERVFSPNPLSSLEGVDKAKVEAVSPPLLDQDTLLAYRLTPYKAKGNRLNTMLFLLMVIGAGIFLLMPDKAPPPPVVVSLSPEAQWLVTYQSSVSPSSALINAERALIMGTLMPDGIEANKIELNGEHLDMRLTLLTTHNHNEWTQWQRRHPTLMTYYSKKEGTLTLPVSNHQHQRSLPPYHSVHEQQLIQRLQLLGVVIELMPESASSDRLRVHAYQLSVTAFPLGALSTLTEILQSPMLSLNHLDLTLDKSNLLSGRLHLTLQGVTP